jgi:hypothetical protein
MYNGNLEWVLTIRDFQADPDIMSGPQDLSTVAAQIAAMQAAPLGEPGSEYDARSVFDSRPTNAFDAVFSGDATAATGTQWQVLFSVPLGYRACVRAFTVSYDNPGAGPISNSTVTPQLQGASVPYNGPVFIGPGTTEPIEVFYLAEEGATFGLAGTSFNIGATTVYVNCRVNLIPVTLEQLSYAVENRIPGT